MVKRLRNHFTCHPMQVKLSVIACVAFLLTLTASVSFAQVSLVKDINRTNETYAYDFSYMQEHKGFIYLVYNNELWRSDGTREGTSVVKSFDHIANVMSCGNYLYFLADEMNLDSDTGYELWRSDGTPEGTIEVKDINPGSAHSNPRSLTDVDGTLFFVANNGVNGLELWRSDGTEEGTYLVKDIMRVSGNSNPHDLASFQGQVYFRANDGANGYELWRSDGTEAGTTLAADINIGSKASSSPEQMVAAGGKLFFIANDVSGKQLWTFDGISATKVETIGGSHNAIGQLTAVDDIVFFQANDGTHGTELWRSDGTDAGTFMVKDITPGPGSASQYATAHIEYIRGSNGNAYFLAVEESYQELWTSDGTEAGTYKITEENNIGFTWTDHGSTSYNGETYFAGVGENQYGLQLWKTDGTVAGNTLVHENIGDEYYNNMMATELNGKLYFIGKSELWVTDGSRDGTQIVKMFGEVAHSSPRHLTDLNGTLLFEAMDYSYGFSLWKSNGTAATTEKVNQYLRQAAAITNVNGTAYFSGLDYKGEELWKSDGTEAGTMLVKDISTDPYNTFPNSSPYGFTGYNGKVYFAARLPYRNHDLWVTDGTEAGTHAVDPAEPHLRQFANPQQFTVAGGKLFFTAESPKGNELHVYDGINAPTLVRDVKLHWEGSHPINLTEFNGILYFQADNRGNGYELFRSDGTQEGTYIVKDIRRDDLGETDVLAVVDMSNMIATTQSLFFGAIKPNGMLALWKSNGIASGTVPLKEFSGRPGVHMLATSGNKVFFELSYPTHMELWESDGTSAGTRMIVTINEVNNLQYPIQKTSLNGVTYFLAKNSTETKIIRTDWTASGTYPIVFDGTPYELEASGGKVYLSGSAEEVGWELFVINDETPAAVANVANEEMSGSSEMDEVQLNVYPNPFSNYFSVQVNGDAATPYHVKVVDANGAVIEAFTEPHNTERMIGENWKEGFYTLQISTEGKTVSRRVIKTN